jgi:2-keto-4-pentenoate hydratase/2-oxohepta-3-ene-1,7-dioic acid hydratase in catechol pathway
MKIATYEHEGARHVGIVVDEAVRAVAPELDVLTILNATPQERQAFLDAADDPTPLASVTLLPPLHPPSVRDFVAFEQHIEGMVMTEGPGATVPDAWYEAPAWYFSNPNALFADGDDIEIPPRAERLDYELEVAAIIGTPGRDLTLENAESHIAGYAIFNDWSAWAGRRARTSPRRSGRGS